MNKDLIKQALDIDQNEIIYITKVAGGFNIRLSKINNKNLNRIKEKSFLKKLKAYGESPNLCRKCFTKTRCHPHHIIPKSSGGRDEPDNGVFLCFSCHVGDNGIHNNKWDILDIITPEHYAKLKRRYQHGQ